MDAARWYRRIYEILAEGRAETDRWNADYIAKNGPFPEAPAPPAAAADTEVDDGEHEGETVHEDVDAARR